MLINDASITGSLIVNASASFQNISVGGNIIPDETNIRNLGSTDKYFKEIYVSTGSINFVDETGIVGTLNAGTITAIQSNTSSANSRLDSIESVSASLQSFTASISETNVFTSSATVRLNALETTSASVDTLNTAQNNRLGSLEEKTGSLATTGSNTFYGQQVFSGSLYVQNDLIVQGSSSLQNITASAVSIGTNIVYLNTDTPAVRFAGLTVQDSGSSAGVTGSILWDSLCNKWIYSNPSTIGYSGGMFLSGPRTQTLGTEPTLTCNYIAKSGGGDHLYDSCIIDNGTSVCVKGNLISIGTISGTDIYASTVSCSPVGCFGILCTDTLFPSTISMGNTFIKGNGSRIGIGTNNPLGTLSIGLGGGGISGLATYSSIEPLGIFNMFYTNSGTYPFYLDIAAIGDTMGGSTGGSNIRFLTHCGSANATPAERMRITNTGSSIFYGCTTFSCTAEFSKIQKSSNGNWYTIPFMVEKGSATGSARTVCIVDINNLSQFHEFIVNIDYGARLQGISDQTTNISSRMYGINRFNNDSVAITDSSIPIGSSGNINTHAPVTVAVAASNRIVIKVDFSTGPSFSSFVWGEIKVFSMENLNSHLSIPGNQW
jgi:hypothetical protein